MKRCVCGCDGSMEGKRPHAKWHSDACRERAKRRANGSTGRIGRPPTEQLYVVDANGCWIWRLGYSSDGRPTISRGKSRIAHRWMYERERGPIPDGYECHHACQNIACVNPAHMEIVTRDEHAKLHPRAGRPQRKLTESVVRAMRAGEMTVRDAATACGTTYLAAWYAKTGRSWQHIT